ncbi:MULTISPECIES: methionyl-tRNA formyltransferase [Fusobacterium]|uniref:methionyl-tRNA formyltransferase n=1 Tax=Fusobacterium TaxID=848 RepID=UPI001EED7504|nr:MULTISPECIES: methionyl-tRNA formyltransferase [Fusobacterium]MCF2611958.1 methionyl-tRNA formyltransferase [Fusobacterium perfoetens]MDY2981083.1 methionyl-tRNA formyltransferase [Fusobacterium sp.]
MRILFMGTPDFAVPCLEILDKKHEIIGVFTKVDKINKRGKKIEYLPVKQYAIDKNIPIYQPNSLKDEETKNIIKELNPDLIVVVAYGKIIPKDIIDMPKFGIINVHSSLLPRFRGAAPINAALMAGDEKSGVTIMYVAEGLDTGNIILAKETPITEEDNFETLHDRLKFLGAEALDEAVTLIEKGENESIPQDETLATFVKPFKKEDLKIDWNKSKEEIFNFVRGISPVPCAWTIDEDKLLKVYEVKKYDKVYENGVNGEIVDKIKGKGPVVKVIGGSLIITSAKPESKKILSGADLLNGNFIKVGNILK